VTVLPRRLVYEQSVVIHTCSCCRGTRKFAESKRHIAGSKGKIHLIHFVVINMSGAAREVHHRRDTVPLPIAIRVPLQVPAGDSIEITSNTDNKVEDVVAITETDEGRTIPIQ
jgi:hypothetical protein